MALEGVGSGAYASDYDQTQGRRDTLSEITGLWAKRMRSVNQLKRKPELVTVISHAAAPLQEEKELFEMSGPFISSQNDQKWK